VTGVRNVSTTAPAVIAIAVLLAACGGSHHKPKTTDHPKNAKLRPSTEIGVAQAFASAYLRYIDGLAAASVLPDATAAVMKAAVSGGLIPANERVGTLSLVGLKTAKGVPGGVLITARTRAGTLYAQETLARARHGWQVVNLLTPDFVQVFVKQNIATIPEPAGSHGPEAAARVFLAGYLPWYYGHGPASAIQRATPALRVGLRAHPPNIPPPMAHLHGQVKGIGMARNGSGWQALVNVHDAASTYQLTLGVQMVSGHWEVTAVSSQ